MNHKKVLVFFIVTSLLVSPMSLFAQTTNKTELENKLREIEAEINTHKQTIEQKKKEGTSLSRDITILNSKIGESKAKIQSQNLQINSLSQTIEEKEEVIQELETKIRNGKDSLAGILRKKNEADGITFVEFALSKQSISDVFMVSDSYDSLQNALGDYFKMIREAKETTQSTKETLEDKKGEALTVKEIQELEKKKAEAIQNEKNKILKVTKGEEKKYQELVKQKEKEAAAIRNAIFALRDTSSNITFGTALAYAQNAEKTTGVRPALVLAVLMQETSLGVNLGSCYLKNDATGSGIKINSGTYTESIMNPTRDVPPFLELMSSLGRDPYTTRVSCPQSFGWGGAMGPSQFIASTWKIFIPRIQNATGASVADPWNASHAVMATSMYLGDLGAGSKKSVDEKNAACRYYSGRACSRSSAANSYGSSVLSKMADIQSKIDILQGN